jgi:hypothetical protein
LLIGEGNVEANEIIAPQQRGSMTRGQLQTVLTNMDSAKTQASAADLRGTFDAMFRFYPPPATTLLQCALNSAAMCGHHAHADASTHLCLLSHFNRLDGRFFALQRFERPLIDPLRLHTYISTTQIASYHHNIPLHR